MAKVICTAGCSGSGKTFWARQFIAENPGWVIVSRDDLRVAQGFPPVGSQDQEKVITKLQRGLIESALLDNFNVIVADTNLNKDIRNSLVKYIHKLGYDVEFNIFDVPLETCIARDAAREKPVGEVVIRRQYDKFKGLKDAGFKALEDAPVQKWEKYLHVEDDRPWIVAVDLDGTMAEGHRRSPYDYSLVHQDDPIVDIIETVKAMQKAGYMVIFVSGRPDSARELTELWLSIHFGDEYELFMRQTGDVRPDYVVKNEIYDSHIIPRYNIRIVYDDRDQVIKHLRNRGITVAQVAPGRF